MLLSKHLQKLIKQINPAKLYHRAMYNTQCGLKNLNRNEQTQSGESQLQMTEVYQRAYETFLDENYEESAKLFKMLKKLDSKNIHNQINYSIALQKSNKPYDGLKAIKKALTMIDGGSAQKSNSSQSSEAEEQRSAPNPFIKASALAIKAQCLGDLKYVDEALKFYEEAASLNNLHYTALGTFCLDNQKYCKALLHFRNAANSKNSSLKDVMFGFIKTLFELRLFKACFELSERYSFLFHNDFEGLYYAGMSSAQLNQKEKAKTYLEMAVSLAPNEVGPVAFLSQLLKEEGQPLEALTLLQKFLILDSTRSEIYLAAAEILSQLKENRALCREYLYQSLHLAENNLRAYILLAENSDNVSEQMKVIEEGLNKFNDSHELIYLKSLTHSSLNNHVLQVKSLERCVDLYENHITDYKINKIVGLKYYQKLIEAYDSQLRNSDLNEAQINEIQDKLIQLKEKSQHCFAEVCEDSVDLSTLDNSQIGSPKKIFDEILEKQNSACDLDLSSYSNYEKFLVLFSQYQNLLESNDYEKSLPTIEEMLRIVEKESTPQQFLTEIKSLNKKINKEEIFDQMEGTNDLKSYLIEQKEILQIALQIKNIFPLF